MNASSRASSRLFAAALLCCPLLGGERFAAAADFTLSASDTLGNNSFATGLNWPGGAAPSAGNNYFSGDFVLRTPADGLSHAFAGDTLTINNTGPYSQGLLFKGTGTTGVVTVNNLVVAGGRISHANGTGDLFQLAGNMTVTGIGEIYAKQGHINLLGSITGSGGLSIPSTDAPTETNNRQVRFLGATTLAGDITVAAGGKLREDATGSFQFNIGAAGVNNKITGGGWAQFDGAFNFNLTGASTTPGASWTIADVTTQSFGTTFAVNGFTKSGDFWTNGTYLFNPLSGTLSVSAPPIAWNVDGSGNWGVGANWTGGAVPTAGSEVNFGGVLTAANAPAVVALNAPVTVSKITFNNANQYTVAGPSALTLTGLAQLSSGNGTHEVSAVIAGASGLVKTGGAAVVLSGANTYTGLTDVQGGTLTLRNVASVNGNATVAAGATLAFGAGTPGAGYNGTFTGDIAGAGQVLLNANLTTETVTFAGAKTFAGQTTLNGGTLAISNSVALGVADGTVASRTLIDGNGATSKLALSGNIAVGNELLIVEAREGLAANAVQLTSAGNNSWAGNLKGETGGSQYNLESTSGTLTLGGVISAPDSGIRNFVFSGAGDFNITGKITDLGSDANGTLPVAPVNNVSSVSVIKQGTGTLTIGTASALQDDFWQANTIVEGGTLRVLSDGASNGELWSPIIDVRAGATLDVSHFGTYSLQESQSLQGSGTVQAAGKTLAVYSDNKLSPGDSVGTLTINANVEMNSIGTGGALNFQLGDVATTIGGSENDLIQIGGALSTPSGSPVMALNVTPVDADLAAGSYRLISHTGGSTDFSGVTPQVIDANGNPLTIRQSLSVSGSTAGQVNLVVTGNEAALTWAGTPGNAWNINSGANWSGGQTFFDLDDVTFNDAAGANDTVDLSTSNVTPGSVTVNSASGNTYTFTGTNGILGAAPVALTGNATAVLANNGNNLSGAVSLASGTTLQQGNGTSAGGTVLSGVVSGAGAIRVNSGTLAMNGANAYTGVTTINGGELNINSATALGDASAGTVINGGSLRSNADAFTVNEPLTLNGGAVAVGGGADAALTLAGPISVNAAGGTLQVDGGGGDDALTVTSNIGGAASGALNLNVDGGSTLSIAGNITNNGNLAKNGSGVAALGATTTIAAPVVTVNTGTLDVSAQGTYTVASGKTLSGNDGGVVLGNVAAASGGTIRVGGAGLPAVPVFNYLDATFGASGNTTLADGSTLTPATNPQWQERTALGNNGNVLQGGSDTANPNEAPVVKISITGLTPGSSHTVYTNYWDATGSSWRILTGPAENSLTLFDSPADAVVGATDGVDPATLVYTTAPLIAEGNRLMWGASLGQLVANGSGVIEVFVDDSGTIDGDDRTWFDGVSYSTGATTTVSEIMTITGDLSMSAGSILAMDIGTPTSFDSLSVSGAFAAGGTLAVALSAGAPSPSLGDVFDLLDFGSASGSFATLSLPSLGSGLAWDTTSLLTTGELSVVAGGGTSGDFNSDGKVNGADFLAWQRNPGVGSLADWKANYGAGSATPNLGTVPEPTGAGLAIGLAALAWAAARRVGSPC